MSSKPTNISDGVYSYLLGHFSSEDNFLCDLKKEAAAAGMPDISISADEGTLMQILLKMINAKYVLEIGSLGGYSSITMARTLPKGSKLIAVEINAEYCDFIRRKANEAGLGDVIEVVNADANEFLDSFKPEQELDFVFIDANKPAYCDYFKKASKWLRPGGIFAADNAFAFGHIADEILEYEPENVNGVRRFNDMIAGSKDFQSTIIPVGDGLAIAFKL